MILHDDFLFETELRGIFAPYLGLGGASSAGLCDGHSLWQALNGDGFAEPTKFRSCC
jgi:hypothetical protein